MFESTIMCGQIPLGKQGEHHARKVPFHTADIWKQKFGEGTFELLHQRSEDEAPYPITLKIEKGIPYWYITEIDTSIPGQGKCELRYIVDDVMVKSHTYTTHVAPSLCGETEPPDAFKPWVDEVLVAAEEVKTATVNQPIIGENGNWFVYDFNVSDYVDTGISASGGSDADLSEYVKNTDYATADVGGVVKVRSGYGLNCTNGVLSIRGAKQTDIDAKTNIYTPITPSTLEYAVKSIGDKIYASAEDVGNIESALDIIVDMQNSLIGGDA